MSRFERRYVMNRLYVVAIVSLVFFSPFARANRDRKIWRRGLSYILSRR